MFKAILLLVSLFWLKDGALLQRALSFYRLVIVWLVDLVGGFKMPLPEVCPMQFACMPEHFVDDAMDLLILTSRIPKALEGFVLVSPFSTSIFNFVLSLEIFSDSSHYKESVPWKFVSRMISWILSSCSWRVLLMSKTLTWEQKWLKYWIVGYHSEGWKLNSCEFWLLLVFVLVTFYFQIFSGFSATAALFEGHQLCLEYLVRNLLKLYVDIEFTGSHTQVNLLY